MLTEIKEKFEELKTLISYEPYLSDEAVNAITDMLDSITAMMEILSNE